MGAHQHQRIVAGAGSELLIIAGSCQIQLQNIFRPVEIEQFCIGLLRIHQVCTMALRHLVPGAAGFTDKLKPHTRTQVRFDLRGKLHTEGIAVEHIVTPAGGPFKNDIHTVAFGCTRHGFYLYIGTTWGLGLRCSFLRLSHAI